jgi:hypothetical protein
MTGDAPLPTPALEGERPLLAIITVTKDDVSGLEATLASTSALRSDRRVRQVVIDSSSPESARRCAALAQAASVAYEWIEPTGISDAFNLGLSRSSAEWIWCLNGGDILHPALSTSLLLEYLAACRAMVVIGQLQPAGSALPLSHPPLWALWPPVVCWIPHPATILRFQLFEQYGTFDQSLKITMDYDLWFRALGARTEVDLVSIPFVVFDPTGLSSSSAYTGRLAREVMSVLRRHWRMLVRHHVRYPARTVRDIWYWYRRL